MPEVCGILVRREHCAKAALGAHNLAEHDQQADAHPEGDQLFPDQVGYSEARLAEQKENLETLLNQLEIKAKEEIEAIKAEAEKYREELDKLKEPKPEQ